MMTVFAITANGKRMTMRLIDADALRNVFDAMHAIPGGSHFDHLVLLGIKKHIDDTPTIDAVPVVRCRECFYKDIPKCCPYQINGFEVVSNWYCPMVVRKMDAKDMDVHTKDGGAE